MKAPRNLVILAMDALRADHLPFYGYSRDTAPNLARRAGSAVIFENAIAPSSWTLPSFASLFTSLHPHQHGMNSRHRFLPEEHPILSELLQAAGLRTASFTGGHFLDPLFGFSRGFDLHRPCGWPLCRFFPETAPQAARWIRKNADKDFFAFVHGNDLHPPFDARGQDEEHAHAFDEGYRGPADEAFVDYMFTYLYNRAPVEVAGFVPPERYRKTVEAVRADPKALAHIVAHYDSRIREADAAVEQVFKTLEETGRMKDTLVVMLADHGMEWGEKGRLATGCHAALYETLTHVPLLLWHPSLSARRVYSPVQLADLGPTLLELLKKERPRAWRDASFAALAQGAPARAPRHAFSSSSLIGDPENRILLHSVRDERWKLICDPFSGKRELYDLEKDRAETLELSEREPAQCARLGQALKEHLGTPLCEQAR
ncbi:MAG: sulfatase [Elusimicrobiota bacterium]|jgi:arylsulfatase A-like enzyme